MPTPLTDFQRYLASATAREKASAPPTVFPQPFLTLSRQSGAGGHRLADAILKQMKKRREPLFQGWQVLDRQLCDLVIDDPKVHVSLNDLRDEEFRGGVEDYVNQIVAGTSPQRMVYKRIFKTVRTVAAVGKVIVLGRAGSSVTRGLSGGVHLRLIAPREERVAALMRLKKLARSDAEIRGDEMDASRARLLRTFFRRNIEDPLLYDAVFNTAKTPFDDLAAIIVEQLRLAAARLHG